MNRTPRDQGAASDAPHGGDAPAPPVAPQPVASQPSVPQPATPSSASQPAEPSVSAPYPSPPLHGDAMRFAGARVLVIGGAHGIGAACAARYAAEGASVVIADLELEAAQQKVAALPVAEGARHGAVAMDVTARTSVDEGTARAAAELGGIDVLAHVAGANEDHPGPDAIEDDVWTRLLDLDLVGPVRTVRAAIPHLRRSERPAIVLVSSVNGLMPLGGEPYSAAKAGLVNLTENLAVRLAPDRIRVTAIAPGTIRTRNWPGEASESVRHLYPLGRVGEGADIAAAAAFLTSTDAAWITGVTLPVDGGFLLTRTGPDGFVQR